MLTQDSLPLKAEAASDLPETIRVLARRGFYAHVDGTLGVVNPGDVVELPRQFAMELRAAGKAVSTDKPLKRQADYVPERKKAARRSGADATPMQLALLCEAVTKLTEVVAARLR